MASSIHFFMLQEHKKIEEMLEKCKRSLLNPVLLKINFKILFNQIQDHFFVEEKVVFSVYEKSKKENGGDVILNLVKDHRDILFDMMKIKDSISRGVNPDFVALEKDLRKHLNFENNYFYKMLDASLSADEKRLIMNEL